MIPLNSFGEEAFSWSTAYALVLSSRLAYKNHDEVVRVVKDVWGYDDCRFIEVDETQAFVASKNDSLILSFRGTDSLTDWLADLTLLPSQQPYGTVHLGFVNAYHSLHDQILNALGDFNAGAKRLWLTGHSLGGALAAIAVTELHDHASIAGCYTFGQPRTGKANFVDAIVQRLPNRFFRFVNNDDLVTRLPPGYKHVGTLLHFDFAGSIIRESSASESETISEPEPLSLEEFEQVRQDAKALEIAAESLPVEDEFSLQAADRSLEGLFSGVTDHRIDRYVGLVRRQIGGGVDTFLLSESSVVAESTAEATVSGAESIVAEPTVPILLRLKNAEESWSPPEGMTIYTKTGAFYTGRATSEQLEALRNDDSVSSVSASRQAGFIEATDAARFVKGDLVQVAPLNERGDAALVGIIDVGIDVLHEAFLVDSPAATGGVGKTRILAVWDQHDQNGPSPHSIDPILYSEDGFKLGTLYTESDINDMIAGLRSIPTSLRDPELHGTFVASIAAGREVGIAPSDFKGGMAPEAGICAVIPDMIAEDGSPDSIGYSISHIAAVKFLKLTAIAREKPIAINISLGMNAGAHDGQSALEAQFDALTTSGRDPGIILIKSAGNEHNRGGHAAVQASDGLLEKISWASSANNRRQDYFEVWYDDPDDLEFTLIDPAGNPIGPVNSGNLSAQATPNGNSCEMELTLNHHDNGDNLLAIIIRRSPNPIQSGEWVLEVFGRKVNSAFGKVDAWVERNNSRPVSFLQGVSNDMTLSIPGTADTVISIASCGASNPITLASSSSRGPTRLGGPKPDLTAPGDAVEGARANSADHRANRIDGGTSFAAPLVTGAVALVLSQQAKKILATPALRQVNTHQVRTALFRSAMHRRILHHPGLGHGVLDAVAFVKEF
jgi:subtilisin family serine protease